MPTPIRVGVFGAGGRMGITVCQAVVDDPELRLVAAVDPHHAGLDLRSVGGVDGDDLQIASSPDELVRQRVDVAVDFTHIDAARENLGFLAARGIHAVVGTSGFTTDDYERLRGSFTASNCVIAPNFAIGAVLMARFAELAAPFFETAEIIELHHDKKVDAPSGTAVHTAERMAAVSDQWAADPTTTHTVEGARGARGAGGIPIHAVRLRGIVAHQEVMLGTTGQTLSIRHDSYDRSSFMPGVVLAVKRVAELPGLTVGLDAVLGV
jgi:4-hydroxy-tetrahydrodipicolinate reductase